MKKFYFIIITLFFGVNVIKAQLPSGKYSDYFREGMFLVRRRKLRYGSENFLEAYKLDSSSANINFNVGFCYLKLI
jgi:hypothetical protein